MQLDRLAVRGQLGQRPVGADGEFVMPVRADDHQRDRPVGLGDEPQQLQRRLIHPLQVVEHYQRRRAVLDVAAGAGGQTLAAARRVGPSGQVLATDISPAILDHAAAAAGLTTVQTRELDGERLDVDPAAFDAVISRLGLMYFPDQPGALAGQYRALRPGGRISAIVFSTADRNGFFSIPISIIRRRAQLPPPAPGQPGPFSLGGPGVLEDVLRQAGFRKVGSQAVPAPLRMAHAQDCVRFERESFGALHQMLAGLTPTEQDQAWQEISTELTRFEGPEGFQGPCELIVAWGVK